MNLSIITRATRFLVLLFCVIGTGTTLAQSDETPPLVDMLALIPDDAAVNENFSFVDYRAVTAAREGAATITSAEEFEALNADESLERDLFWAAYFGIRSGPSDFLSNLRVVAEGMLEVTGIDPFSIEQALTYGSPPGMVDVYAGEFNQAQIAALHSLRGFSQNTTEGGLTLWCGNEECDGMQMNIADRNPANPFGGNLGRQQSLLVGDDVVASSASTARLEQMAAAIAGNSPTLADNPDFAAAAEAITQEGLLLQAWFIHPAQIPALTESAMAQAFGSSLTADELKALIDQMTENYLSMPPYNLLVFADTATESEQIALVALVYHRVEDAEAAAEVLPQRIENYASIRTQAPLPEMLDERGVTAVETEVYDGAERAVVLVRLRAPLASSETIEDSDRLTASSMVFNLISNMLFQRDTGWLAISP